MVGANVKNRWHFSSVKQHSPKRLSMFTIELTQQCNFRCTYCCYSGEYENNRKHNSLVMSDETLDKTIRFILNNRFPETKTSICFYGGEALLANKQLRLATNKLVDKLGDSVGFSLSTNGYNLTPVVIDWICSFKDFEVYITIDGYKELHDANRKTKDGYPTYDTIIDNLVYFKESYPEQYEKRVGFLVTLKSWKQLPEVSKKWQENSFLKDKIPNHLSFILPKNLYEMRHPTSTLQEKEEVLELAYRDYTSGIKSILVSTFVEWTDEIIRGLQNYAYNNEILTNTCLEDLYKIFITANGDIYLCERINSNFPIGNVTNGIINDDKLKELEDSFISQKNRLCSECEAVTYCTMCMTNLNYKDEELSSICKNERSTMALLKEYAWKRRMFDRQKSISKI